MEKVFKQFNIKGKFISINPYGKGNINDTFLVRSKDNGNHYAYILQKINHNVFKDIDGLMNNIESVTTYIKANFPNSVLQKIIKTKDDKSYYIDKTNGSYWRVYTFVEDGVSFEEVTDPEQFYETGIAFGYFQKQLKDFDTSLLVDTIKNFHNTKERYNDFLTALENNLSNRAHLVEEEIEFLISRKKYTCVVIDLLEKKLIPIRVTHNDTKLNNVLLHKQTGLALSVIDLDTIMPGSILYDFGDAIRYGANTAAEDEVNLSLVGLDLKLFEAFTKGYLKYTAAIMNKYEIENLAFSALLITYELSLRFLEDYLNGDAYFKTDDKEHNLRRARTQIALLKDMEKQLEQMKEIVKRLYSESLN